MRVCGVGVEWWRDVLRENDFMATFDLQQGAAYF